MLKTLVLVCAAMTTCTASGYGIHMSGWLGGNSSPTPQVQSSDPLHSDAAMRYRLNQSTQWRMVMSIR